MPEGTIAVVTGFIGKDASGRITTLGRGGSDLTAALLGAAAELDEVQCARRDSISQPSELHSLDIRAHRRCRQH